MRFPGTATTFPTGAGAISETLLGWRFHAWRLPCWRWALLIAALSDAIALGTVILGPFVWLFDVVTAAALFMVLRFRWSLLSALTIEVIPVLQVFTARSRVVLALASTGKAPSPAVADQTVPKND